MSYACTIWKRPGKLNKNPKKSNCVPIPYDLMLVLYYDQYMYNNVQYARKIWARKQIWGNRLAYLVPKIVCILYTTPEHNTEGRF